MKGHRSVANKKIFLYGPQGGNWTLNADSEGVAHFSLDTSLWSDDVATLHAQCTEHSTPGVHGYFDRCLAYHTTFKFYSKSKSFLNINHVKEPLPCNQDGQVQAQYIIRGEELKEKNTLHFFHLVLCKGSIVQHGRHEITLNEGEVQKGELSLSLQHTEDLAPYAQLVLYTVLPNGEVVADSYDYPIQLCFKNKVSLQFSSSVELPGEKALLEVTAQPGSLCSLRAIDQSVLLMKPDEELTTQKVYEKLPVQKLSGYPPVVRDRDPRSCFSPVLDEPLLQRGPGHPFFSHGPPDKTDPSGVFHAVGVKALTNLDLKKPVICLHYRYGIEGVRVAAGPRGEVGFGGVGQDRGTAIEIGVGMSAPRIETQAPPPPPPPPKETIRTFFPETWIWDLVPVGDAGTVTVQQTVPDTITTWAASAFCTSPAGFGLAPGINLKAFQPFFVSLTLPYSVIRGEVFPLKATVFNYLSKCIMVHVRLRESAEFTGQPCDGCQYKRCLCGEESGTFTWVVTATSLGRVNISVSAEALSSEELCGNEVITVPERGQIDTVVRKLLVEPEGTTQTISHNALLCPQGRAVEKAISLELPEVFVEGSAKAFLSVLGDLMGRAMKNLDRLYLETTEQLTLEIKSKAITFLKSGYQRELNYRHNDGSYSAFGQSDPSGNTWLTAFVMKSFGGATRYIFIDSNYITSAKLWLSLQQQEDGCMRSVGKLFHNGMKGGVSDEVMLTAYITAALLELGTNITVSTILQSRTK
ncbi:hypothetical protein GJAV_G00137580 [Gymnothorax javanicus]|nr:hypothetical protein GJAV_G00137580 [Gymnothorax javanicus]